MELKASASKKKAKDVNENINILRPLTKMYLCMTCGEDNYVNIIGLNSDGRFDSSFKPVSFNGELVTINVICSTLEGRILVGGRGDVYKGYSVPNLVSLIA
jgi:DNA-directed RNA polymerase subunit RPC12/RpoP